jgi:hypothetical protein
MPSAPDRIFVQGGGYGPPGGYGGPPPGAPPAGYPPGGPSGYGPPGYGPPGPPYGPPLPPGSGFGAPGSPNYELKKQATTWLIISAVSLVVCGCCFGLVGVVFCFMAMQAVDQGNVADAQSKLKWGKIITVVGFAMGIVAAGISALVYGAEIAAAVSSYR